METISYGVLAVLALGLLIIVHEGGHYLAARWSGMTVRRFSIGFGPPLAQFERWGTVFQIGVIPLGGFVQIDGLNPHDGTDPRAPGSYASRPFHLRFATILAGPAANYLFGFIGFFVYFAYLHQVPVPPFRVVRVVAESPAETAGLKAGDLLVGTSSRAFTQSEDLGESIQGSGGQPMTLRVQREGALETTVVVHPVARPGGEGFMVGIMYEGASFEERALGIAGGARAALASVVNSSLNSAKVVASLFNPKERSQVELQGPPGIVQDLTGSLRASKAAAIQQIALISAALGWANLLPIPGLDGSRLLFLLLGLIRRKEVNPRVEAAVHAVGLVLLFGLIITISIGDLWN